MNIVRNYKLHIIGIHRLDEKSFHQMNIIVKYIKIHKNTENIINDIFSCLTKLKYVLSRNTSDIMFFDENDRNIIQIFPYNNQVFVDKDLYDFLYMNKNINHQIFNSILKELYNIDYSNSFIINGLYYSREYIESSFKSYQKEISKFNF